MFPKEDTNSLTCGGAADLRTVLILNRRPSLSILIPKQSLDLTKVTLLLVMEGYCSFEHS